MLQPSESLTGAGGSTSKDALLIHMAVVKMPQFLGDYWPEASVPPCYELHVSIILNSYVKALISKVIVFGD